MAKKKLITEMKERDAAEGKESDFKVGTYEILVIANEAHKGMVEKNLKEDSVLAGMRRNGFLSWRPDLEQGKFVRSDEQAWCQNPDGSVKFQEGSHRLRDEWLHERYNFLDAEGKPVKEDWTRSSGTNKVNKLGEPEDAKEFYETIVEDRFTKDYKITRGGKQITIPVLDLDEDQEAIFDAELLSGVLKTPRERRLELRANFKKELEEMELKRKVGSKDCGKDAKVQKQRATKIDYALKDLNKAWHEGMEEDLKEKTVEEIFALLLPGAGTVKERKKRKMTKSKLKKDCNALVSYFFLV